MSKRASHLLDEPPILAYPSLAKMIGINEALIFQQLHFLLNGVATDNRQFNYVDGRWWVYNSYADWQCKFFLWLSQDRIKRLFLSMEEAGYIISRKGVKNAFDREKWYSIDYEQWERFKADYEATLPEASDETAQSIGLKQPDGEGYNNPMYIGLKQPDDSYKKNKNTKKKESDSLPLSISIALDEANEKSKSPSDNGMIKHMDADVLIRAYERAHRESGIPQTVRRSKNVYQAATQYWDDGYREAEVYDTVKALIDDGESVPFPFLSEALAQARLKKKPKKNTIIYIDPNDEPDDSDSLTRWLRKPEVS